MRMSKEESQAKILAYIRDEIQNKGYPPSVRDICAAAGLSSPSTVHSHLHRLEKAGYIKRAEGQNRSIRLVGEERSGVPILGTVAAGSPILAVEDAIGRLPYDPEHAGEYFALRIKGDSMINAGILDGDTVIVARQETARTGEIVVAMVDDGATVKRFYREDGHFRLQPENDAMDPIIVNECRVLGKVVGLLRLM